MNRDIGRFLGPAFAALVFAFVLWQTLGALQAAGVWRFGARPAAAPAADPLAALDAHVSRALHSEFAGASRDPFGYGAAAAPAAAGAAPGPRRPAPPPAPALPVLTAIIYDADPRALVRWDGREYSIRAGSLFAEFEVVSIARDQVVLKRGSESLVLRRQP